MGIEGLLITLSDLAHNHGCCLGDLTDEQLDQLELLADQLCLAVGVEKENRHESHGAGQ